MACLGWSNAVNRERERHCRMIGQPLLARLVQVRAGPYPLSQRPADMEVVVPVAVTCPPNPAVYLLVRRAALVGVDQPVRLKLLQQPELKRQEASVQRL